MPDPLGASLFADREKIGNSFDGYVEKAFKGGGVVFTVVTIRQMVLSEARFAWQQLRDGRPDELFYHDTLSVLERPWVNATTGELISRMEQDASLAGNFFGARIGKGDRRRLRRLRPDWVSIATGVPRDELRSPDEKPSPWDLRAEVIGYWYSPPGEEPVLLEPDEVIHYAPHPDPAWQWRGMSWITAVTEDVEADQKATKHKAKFFDNGATSNLILSYDPQVSKENVKAFSEMFRDQYEGVDRAYKTIHVGGGVDPKTAGATMRQLDFKATQGAGETRVAAASLVGAVVAQLSEGMQGSSLNAGNFKVAARRFADIAARPLLRMMAGSLESILERPDREARLWYDDRDIPFFSDDAKDAAEILGAKANAIRTLADGGFDPDTVRDGVVTGDLQLLEHTGLPSVQVQSPGASDLLRVPVSAAGPLLEAGWTLVGNGRVPANTEPRSLP